MTKSRLWAVALYWDKPYTFSKHNCPEHMTMDILSAETWMNAGLYAVKIHEDKGDPNCWAIEEITEAPHDK